MTIDEKTIERIVKKVAEEIGNASDLTSMKMEQGDSAGGAHKAYLYDNVDEAVNAAFAAQKVFLNFRIEDRKRITDRIKTVCMAHAEELAKMELEETHYGNYPDKLMKMKGAITMTPSVEDLTADICADDGGMAMYEHAPFGVIGALTPSTNPPETVIANAIMMIAAGNAVVFSTHPGAFNSSCRAVELVTQAIEDAGGPRNLVVSINHPTMERTAEMMNHPKVTMLCATGGPGVVKAILSCGKKGIGAGAGNPPVFVDSCADIPKAARDIVAGAGYENNTPCIAEKEIIVVDSVADELITNMVKAGAYLIEDEQTIKQLTDLCMPAEDSPNKKMIGRSPAYILSQIGVTIPEDTRIAIFEAPKDHMLVMNEQMMPIIPVVRVRDAQEGIALSCTAENGRRHTALCHSKNMDVVTELARRIQTTIFVVNGSCFNGLGFNGGIGPNALTIAGPTGEGPTTPRTFTRKRKIVMVDNFNIR